MNILVTGGAGFIGSELVRQLIFRKHRVTVFDDLSFGKRKNVWGGVRFVRGDLREKKDVARVVDRKYDVVFHLAALHFIPYCNAHPLEAISVNVVGTHLLLEAFRKRPPRRFFFASTAAVYGISSKPHRESEKPAPIDIYGVTKLAGERLVQDFHKDTGVRSAVGRLFNAYGPRETNPHLIPSIVEQILNGKKKIALGNLSPARDYIHTSDVARAIYALTFQDKKKFTLANVGTGTERSVREVMRVFSRALGRPLNVQSQKKLRRKVERMHLRPDVSLLKRLTGFCPGVEFEEGIRSLL